MYIAIGRGPCRNETWDLYAHGLDQAFLHHLFCLGDLAPGTGITVRRWLRRYENITPLCLGSIDKTLGGLSQPLASVTMHSLGGAWSCDEVV